MLWKPRQTTVLSCEHVSQVKVINVQTMNEKSSRLISILNQPEIDVGMFRKKTIWGDELIMDNG